MADTEYNAEEAAELKKKRTFRKFSYRGIDLDQLLDLSSEQLRDVVHARARRRFNRGLKRKPMGLIKKLRKAKQNAKPNEKPDLVKTHLRDMIVVPEMIGSVIGIYSGKEFNQVEIKPEMVGFYLGEFSISYKADRIFSSQQTCQARKTGYWCNTFFAFHSFEVGKDSMCMFLINSMT
ncbi:MAG: hypothetical protein Q9190_001555 [Brigantiaea leucoxantha]